MERRHTHYKGIILLGLLCLAFYGFGQPLKQRAFTFLSLPGSARLSALGGELLTISDGDVNLSMITPGLSNAKMDKAIAINYNFLFDGIANGQVAYGMALPKWGINAHAGIVFANYGEFDFADEIGVINGTFKANEMAIVVGASKALNEKITAGLNLKSAFSNFESYKSSALALDASIHYQTNEGRTALAFAIQNIGTELTTYSGQRYGLPLNVLIGLTNKLKHMPLRFGVIFQNLQQWSIRYDDPTFNVDVDLLGQEIEKSNFSTTVDNFFRHIIFNGEFLLGKNENFIVRGGYNHLRRQELKVSQFRSLGGFSIGFGMKIKQFRIDYGVGYYHLAGGTNHLSIATNLGAFK